MVNLLRKYQQQIMIVITVIIIIAFGFWGSSRSNKGGNAPFQGYQIYGQKHSQEELEKIARGFGIARFVGFYDLLQGLCGAVSEQEAVNAFVVNSFVLEHEAQRLGIVVDDNEVEQCIEKLPRFQNNGVFDSEQYKKFRDEVLRNPRNDFNDERFENLARNQVRVQKLMQLLGCTVKATPAQFRNLYIQQMQKMHVSVIRFALADFKGAIQPTDEEINKVFKDREKTYVMPEKRSVSYVKFDLSELDKALKGKELLDARQKLATSVEDFGQEMLKENASFAEVAKKFNVEVKTTSEFAQSEPPKELETVPEAAAVTFKLNEKEATSDPLPAENAYCILHLEKVTPGRPLTFEEAKPTIIEQIKAEKASSMVVARGQEVQAKISADLKAGKSFADAAKDAGQKVEELPVFSMVSPAQKIPNIYEIISKAVMLHDGSVSDFVPLVDGGLIVHMDSREPIDEAQFKKDEETQMANFQKMQDTAVFADWLQMRTKQTNLRAIGSQRAQ